MYKFYGRVDPCHNSTSIVVEKSSHAGTCEVDSCLILTVPLVNCHHSDSLTSHENSLSSSSLFFIELFSILFDFQKFDALSNFLSKLKFDRLLHFFVIFHLIWYQGRNIFNLVVVGESLCLWWLINTQTRTNLPSLNILS